MSKVFQIMFFVVELEGQSKDRSRSRSCIIKLWLNEKLKKIFFLEKVIENAIYLLNSDKTT
jgi:hypothetical protein